MTHLNSAQLDCVLRISDHHLSAEFQATNIDDGQEQVMLLDSDGMETGLAIDEADLEDIAAQSPDGLVSVFTATDENGRNQTLVQAGQSNVIDFSSARKVNGHTVQANDQTRQAVQQLLAA